MAVVAALHMCAEDDVCSCPVAFQHCMFVVVHAPAFNLGLAHALILAFVIALARACALARALGTWRFRIMNGGVDKTVDVDAAYSACDVSL